MGSAIARQFRNARWEAVGLGRGDLDLTDRVEVKRYFSENPCDLLVCAAGIVRDQPLVKMETAVWDEVFEVNFTAARNCAAAAVESMAGKGGGHVIFVSSYAAMYPAVGQAAYATAKAALLGLTKGLAAERGADGVRVNAVLPGFLETKMTEGVSGKRKDIVREQHVLGKFNTVEAAAEFFVFLEERMKGTSGQLFQLDSRP